VPMNKNRIRGLCPRVSWQRAAKPISIKTSRSKSGGGALKAVELTTGDLLHVVVPRLEEKRFSLNVQQESAKGIVVQQNRTRLEDVHPCPRRLAVSKDVPAVPRERARDN